MAIRITDDISLDDSEIEESFVRSSGPGGQNVNKLSTAVQLRFDVRRSPSLPNDVAVRLMRLGGKRITKDGVLVLVAQNQRTQERNRADALERLVALIQEAAVRPVQADRHQADQSLEAKAAGGKESPLQYQGLARARSHRWISGDGAARRLRRESAMLNIQASLNSAAEVRTDARPPARPRPSSTASPPARWSSVRRAP